MDYESGESMEPVGEVPLIGLGETELQRLVRGWRGEAGSWFQRRGEAYWKERSVIDDADGRAIVTKDEERVLPGVWPVMRLCRYEGWVVVRTLLWKELVLNVLGYFNQCRDWRMGVMWLDSGALTTARAIEFWICYSRVIWDLGSLW